MSTKARKAINSREVEHVKLLNGFQPAQIPKTIAPQWVNPTDMFVKFSLYDETPNSITSTDTKVQL